MEFPPLELGAWGSSALVTQMADLRKAGIELGYYAPVFEPSPLQIVQPRVLSLRDLGLPQGGRHREVLAAVPNAGKRLCSPDVGPTARMVYNDQPEGWQHTIFVAMDPLAAPESKPDFRDPSDPHIIWKLANGNLTNTGLDGKLWLFTQLVTPDSHFPPDALFMVLD